ncbi:MAG: tetratricopeptide repeat protein [Planctomycetes bacterium]|nr:tetratricopeptide repeat protein [Planctomycetota bacterium]
MIRNHPEIRFEFGIHEQVLPSIRRLGGEVQRTDISVVHSGADHTPEGRQRKYVRDLRILGRELESRPEHPFVLFNLGMTHADMDDHESTIGYLNRCVAVSAHDESHLRKAYALLVSSLGRCGKIDEACGSCRAGLEAFPGDPELQFRHGMLAHSLGRLQESESAYLEVLQPGDSDHFSSVDPGIVSYKARHNLGLVYEAMERLDLAEVQWRNANVNHLQYAPSRRAMIDLLIRQARLQSAQIDIEQMLSDSSVRCDGLILSGLVEEVRGNTEDAKRWLEDAVNEYPDREEPIQALCRLLFEHEMLAEAEIAIERLLSQSPIDAAAYHNLGVVLERQGKRPAAVKALQRSLELRPDESMTQEQLDSVLSAQTRPK